MSIGLRKRQGFVGSAVVVGRKVGSDRTGERTGGGAGRRLHLSAWLHLSRDGGGMGTFQSRSSLPPGPLAHALRRVTRLSATA